MRRVVLAVLAVAACGGSEDAPAPAPAPPPTLVAPVDAAATDGGMTELPRPDPGMHVDDDDGGDPATAPRLPSPRSRRTLEILLRSTPPGATALVDGRVMGTTPTYWEGDFTGRAREFTFVLPGHALARYRFVPIQNGVVHAKLIPVLSDVPTVAPAIPPLTPDPEPSRTRPVPPDAAAPALPPPPGTDAGAADEPMPPETTPDPDATPAPGPAIGPPP